MNVKHNKITTYMALGLVLVILLIFIPFPQGASLKAMVTASTQFQIMSNGTGSYSTQLKDLWKNQTLQSNSVVPDRGS